MEFLLAALGVVFAVWMILAARKRNRKLPEQPAENRQARKDKGDNGAEQGHQAGDGDD
jgi:hypothetical protein